MRLKNNKYDLLLWLSFATIYLTPVVLADDRENRQAGMYLGASSAKTLGCIPGQAPDPVRGITAGCTYFELQKLGSMGRQIATSEPDHIINFLWTGQHNNSATANQDVYYDSWDPASFLPLGGAFGITTCELCPPKRATNATIDGVSNGTVVVAFDWDISFGFPPSRSEPFFGQNQTPSLADFVGRRIDTTLWMPHLQGDGTTFDFPKVAHTETGATVNHLVISGNRTNADNIGLYLRKVENNSWEPAVLIGEAGYERSFVIISSRQSQRVAIAWSGGRGDGTEFGASISRFNDDISGKNDNDTYVMISEDAGLTWGPIQNTTRRPDGSPGGWAPQAKLSILLDEADSLHVVWQALEWVGYDAQFNTRSRMFHWGENTNTVRTAVEANWDPILCNGGDNILNLDNPQLSACNDKLYLTYTQFAPVPLGKGDDCSERALAGDSLGAANGDIYVSVSADGGITWDAPRNLTNTYTPNCDTIPGGANPDCDSDVWHSVIRYGIDMTGQDFDAVTDLTANIDPSYSDIEFMVAQYINDGDPGAAIRGEGGWTNNSVKAIRFGCVEPGASALLASSLPEAGVFTVPEILVPATDTTFTWILENIGATDITGLTISVTNNDPPNSIVASGFGALLASGLNNSDTGIVSLNANGIPLGTATADLVVNGSFLGAPKTFSLNYSIAETPCCQTAGDPNSDGKMGIADVSFLIARIFAGGPAPDCCEAADANGNGFVNIADITYMIARIFAGGPPPVCGPAGMGC